MKRIFALVLAVALIGALLCACGGKSGGSVTTSVSSKYDDGYASKYASSTSTDENGNTVYEFTDEQYDSYLTNHKNSLGADIQKDIAEQHDETYGEYAYINDEKTAVIVGVHEDEYSEETAKKEAPIAAEYGFKYFQNLQTPVNSIKVIYCDANDQNKIFGTFEFTAE